MRWRPWSPVLPLETNLVEDVKSSLVERGRRFGRGMSRYRTVRSSEEPVVKFLSTGSFDNGLSLKFEMIADQMRKNLVAALRNRERSYRLGRQFSKSLLES